MLAHIAGVPVEESLLYLAPVILLVAWMYYAGWRERRSRTDADEEEEERHPPPGSDRPPRTSGGQAFND